MDCRRREEALPLVGGLGAIYNERDSEKDSCAHLGAIREFGRRTNEALKSSGGAYKGDLVA